MNIDNTLVTVYILSYNYGHFLDKAIQSVLKQSYCNWELFIIDDNSSDNTYEIAKKYHELHPEKINIYRNKNRIGLQRSANYVLKKAKGQYIIRLDGDDWFTESALLVLTQRALKDDSPSIVFGSYLYVDNNENFLGVEIIDYENYKEKFSLVAPHGACTLFKVRSLVAAGGYSNEISSQDGWDIWYKLIGKSKCASIDTPIFYYRQHSNSLSRTIKKLLKARADIFSKRRISIEDDYKPKVIAVLPVNESYDHIKNIPYQEIGGKSLLEHAINNIQSCPNIDELIVSSSSEFVLDFSHSLQKSFKVKPHLRFLRSKRKNEFNFDLNKVLLESAEFSYENKGERSDIVVYVNLHSYMSSSRHLSKAIDLIRITETDTILSVIEERNPIVKYDNNGISLIGKGKFDNLYHHKDVLYKFNGAIIVTWIDTLLKGSIWNGSLGFIEMESDDQFIIDSKSALEFLRDELKNK